jgi:hypothetical protein
MPDLIAVNHRVSTKAGQLQIKHISIPVRSEPHSLAMSAMTLRSFGSKALMASSASRRSNIALRAAMRSAVTSNRGSLSKYLFTSIRMV